jgi:Ni,Fe-hydrogenase I large subunit
MNRVPVSHTSHDSQTGCSALNKCINAVYTQHGYVQVRLKEASRGGLQGTIINIITKNSLEDTPSVVNSSWAVSPQNTGQMTTIYPDSIVDVAPCSFNTLSLERLFIRRCGLPRSRIVVLWTDLVSE